VEEYFIVLNDERFDGDLKDLFDGNFSEAVVISSIPFYDIFSLIVNRCHRITLVLRKNMATSIALLENEFKQQFEDGNVKVCFASVMQKIPNVVFLKGTSADRVIRDYYNNAANSHDIIAYDSSHSKINKIVVSTYDEIVKKIIKKSKCS
jgi:hypothetical protein